MITNQQYMADLRPDDWYNVAEWLFHHYGKRFTNTRFAVCSWLTSEVQVGQWQKVSGYVTAGGDPVYKCPRCGFDEHVYGIEHPSERRIMCSMCGCFNMYGYTGRDTDADDTGTDAGGNASV